jgi:hypothetical protein
MLREAQVMNARSAGVEIGIVKPSPVFAPRSDYDIAAPQRSSKYAPPLLDPVPKGRDEARPPHPMARVQQHSAHDG